MTLTALHREATEADRLVWSLDRGDHLICRTTHIQPDTQRPAFTAGTAYIVRDMFPLTTPPYVRAVGDDGQLHVLTGNRIAAAFIARRLRRATRAQAADAA